VNTRNLIVIVYVFLPYLIILEINKICQRFKIEKSKINLYLFATL